MRADEPQIAVFLSVLRTGGRKSPTTSQRYESFLPVRRYASAGISYGHVSVRPSVRPSVTSRHCVETAERIDVVLAWRQKWSVA